jgi:uncharacterized protein (TIGR00375 family)
MELWARRKGLSLLGTGDITHPGWLKEIRNKLKSDGRGLFELKREYTHRPEPRRSRVKFMLTGEISSIFNRKGRVYRTHLLIFLPGLAEARKVQSALSAAGMKINSDGRPITGIDPRRIMELLLKCSDRINFIPAHIWSPWFSLLGERSGFNSVKECFGDLSEKIFAVETGLSTDPPMHRKCSFLDRFTLISNSDAHSPEKLARNCNIFNCEMTYDSIMRAIASGDSKNMPGTVELFPQEGKYFYDGHRKCGIKWPPSRSRRNKSICPVCGKKLTIGVAHRVQVLSDRKKAIQLKTRFYSIIPLKEIISEITGTGARSKKVATIYDNLLGMGINETELLVDLPLRRIENITGPLLAEALKRMRGRKVVLSEGFDGVFGSVKLFNAEEKSSKTFKKKVKDLLKDPYGRKRPLYNSRADLSK